MKLYENIVQDLTEIKSKVSFAYCRTCVRLLSLTSHGVTESIYLHATEIKSQHFCC